MSQPSCLYLAIFVRMRNAIIRRIHTILARAAGLPESQ